MSVGNDDTSFALASGVALPSSNIGAYVSLFNELREDYALHCTTQRIHEYRVTNTGDELRVNRRSHRRPLFILLGIGYIRQSM